MTTFLFLKDLFCKWKLSLTSLSPGDWFRWPTTVGTDITSDAALDALLALAEDNPDEQYAAVLFDIHPGDGRLFSPNVTLVFAKPGAGLDFTDGGPSGDFDSRVSQPFHGPSQIFFNAGLDVVFGSFGGDGERLPEWWGARGVKAGADRFDSHAGIQSAINSGYTSTSIYPVVVKFQGLDYWTSQTIMGVNKSCQLKGSRSVRTSIFAMDGFGSDDVLSPPYWDGVVNVGTYFDTPFKALYTFGGSTGWVHSFRGGAADIDFHGNLGGNPGLKLSICWCPLMVGEETIFERVVFEDFNCYGIANSLGGHSNGWVLRDFTIQSFGITNFCGEFTEVGTPDFTYIANEPIAARFAYGQWSIHDGSIVGYEDKAWVGIMAGMSPQGGGGSIKNIHFEHCYDCIQIGRGGGFGSGLGTLTIENIDVYGGRNALVRILDHFQDLVAERPVVVMINLKVVSYPNPGAAAAIPYMLRDDRWGDYAARSSGDHAPGYIRTSKAMEVLGGQWSSGVPSADIASLFTDKQLHIGWTGAVADLDAYVAKTIVWGDALLGGNAAGAPQFCLASFSGERFTQRIFDPVATPLIWTLWSSLNGIDKMVIEEGTNGNMLLLPGAGIFLVDGLGRIGFGTGKVGFVPTTPGAKLHLKTDAAIAAPVQLLEQLDVDQPFIDFVGTLSNDTLSSLSDLNTSGAPTHHIRCKVNGLTGWIPFSTNVPT